MKTKTSVVLIFLVPAICLMIGCKSKTKPTNAEEKTATEAVPAKSTEDLPVASDSDNKGKPLGIRSGIIEYSYSGDKNGKSTQYFDDYGMKNAVYAEITANGKTTSGWTVTIGEDQYMWDISNPGQGMKAKNPMIKMLTASSGKDILAYMAEMYEQMGMTQSGTENFLGKECTVFKGDMGKVLIWKGIMMKMEMNLGTMISRQEVTSIKTNVPVAARYFRLPDNITFNEIPGL